MKELKANRDLVSYCWLYCGACKKYLAGRCFGCKALEKTPVWCAIRNCCQDKAVDNCAVCKVYPDVKACSRYNNLMMKFLAYVCGSDRLTATQMIQEKGLENFAKYMAENKLQRISRQKTK